MYYVWKNTGGSQTNFFTCWIDQPKGSPAIDFNFGKEVDERLPSLPLRYLTESKLYPEDFPMTASGFHFLISKKIADILKEQNPKGIKYYDAVIIRPNNGVIKDYYAINIMNLIDCVDMKKSIFTEDQWGPARVTFFQKLVLDNGKIPQDIKLFILKDHETIRIAHESIKEACEKAGVTGIDFIPVEKYKE